MNTEIVANDTKVLLGVLVAFVIVFFAVAAFGLFLSIVKGRDTALAVNCRRSAFVAILMGLILMFFHFVLM